MTHRYIVRAGFVLLVLACQWLPAQPFLLRKDFPASHPVAVISGDFNGDGRTDLAIPGDAGIVVYLNTGGSNFSGPILTEAPPNLFWLGEARDFNNDGKDDLVGSGFLFLSRGDGTFLPGRYVGAQEAVAAGDFNGDGKVDLLMDDYDFMTHQTHGVRIFLGNGDGTFQFRANVTELAAGQVQVADFNGDGRPDVALTPILTPPLVSTIMIFLGHGDGTFGPEIPTSIPAGSGLLAADFDGDGRLDLWTGAGVMMGKGDGTFQAPVPFPGVYPFAAADFTGDGKADLAISTGLYSVVILTGKGDGTFSIPPGTVGQGSSAIRATVADLDRDGRLDLAIVNPSDANHATALLTRAQDSPALRRAVSAASGTAIVAPASLATLSAPTKVTATAQASPPWPNRLGGISLEVRDSTGASRLAPLLYVSATQINFQVPAETALGEATLAIVTDSGSADTGSMQVDPVAPGVFLVGSGQSVPAAYAVLVNPDGTQVPVPVSSCPSLPCEVPPIMVSTAGDRRIYLSVFGTGFRGASPDNVIVSASTTPGVAGSGVRLPVVYAGPQQIPGVDQINVQLIPKMLEADCDPFGFGFCSAYVTISIAGVPANSFTFVVQ